VPEHGASHPRASNPDQHTWILAPVTPSALIISGARDLRVFTQEPMSRDASASASDRLVNVSAWQA
jgi:hypothetical protein